MTVLKWLVVLSAGGYLGGLAVLFFAQRALIFPVPERERTPPQVAGFPQAEEHLLATADGEQVIVWHVPAKPGHAVVVYFPGNGDTLAGSVGRFETSPLTEPGSSRSPIGAMPARADGPASKGS